jgi:hypothetical protein
VQNKYIKFDAFSEFTLVAVVLTQLFFNNGFYLFICVATLVILFYLLQQVHKPAVFSMMLFQHILQVIAGVWLCNYLGNDINYRSPEYSTATVLSVIGIIVLFIPIIYNQYKLPNVTISDLRKCAGNFSTQKAMYCYIIAFFVCAFLQSIAFFVPGISQVLFSLADVKWVFFMLFGFLCILKNEHKKYFYIAISVEFLSGFLSFFSEFKTVIFFVILIVLTLIETVNFKQLLIGAIVGALLVFLGLFWTSIKDQYRSYLNGGRQIQAVSVSQNDALNELYDLSNDVNQGTLASSVTKLLDREQYTYHFAKTIERVPAIIPFQNGNNWLDNLEFTTTPRYLNPNKPTIDNSVKATKYTGIHYLGESAGTSFSLGYFAECYIDYGKIGMMGLLLLIGTIYGVTYFYLIRNSSKNLLFNYCVAIAFFSEFYAFEQDGTYLLGRLFSNMLTFGLLIKFVFPSILKYISNKKDKGERSFADSSNASAITDAAI